MRSLASAACALAQSLLDSAFHCAAIADAALKLTGNVGCHQVSIRIRRFDLFHFQINLLARQCFQLLAQNFDALAFATDQNAGFGSLKGDLDFAWISFDFDS